MKHIKLFLLIAVSALCLLSCESRESRKCNKALDEYEEGIKSGDKEKQIKALLEARSQIKYLKGKELDQVGEHMKELGEKYEEVVDFE